MRPGRGGCRGQPECESCGPRGGRSWQAWRVGHLREVPPTSERCLYRGGVSGGPWREAGASPSGLEGREEAPEEGTDLEWPQAEEGGTEPVALKPGGGQLGAGLRGQHLMLCMGAKDSICHPWCAQVLLQTGHGHQVECVWGGHWNPGAQKRQALPRWSLLGDSPKLAAFSDPGQRGHSQLHPSFRLGQGGCGVKSQVVPAP